MEKLRIAAFGGFRWIPPKNGAAGSDKFAFELYPRITKHGHKLLAYCRVYPGDNDERPPEFHGIELKYYKTTSKAGFDTIVHSAKSTFDIIFHNTADVIHLHSGANSIWAIFLRIAGKRVVVTQFAMDWKRDKWPWYGKLFYLFSNFLTAYIPNKVAFDNVFTKEYFEKKYNIPFDFIPNRSEVTSPPNNINILKEFELEPFEYYLFVGRFIPDKGLHLLVDAFSKMKTSKRLVLIGGTPNPSDYERRLKKTQDERILFPGYLYGDDTNTLIKNAYAYIQPSLIEGLSPVILTVMGLETPVICSNIKENIFITKDSAVTFESGNSKSLKEQLEFSEENKSVLLDNAKKGKLDVTTRFNWDSITEQYLKLLKL